MRAAVLGPDGARAGGEVAAGVLGAEEGARGGGFLDRPWGLNCAGAVPGTASSPSARNPTSRARSLTRKWYAAAPNRASSRGEGPHSVPLPLRGSRPALPLAT